MLPTRNLTYLRRLYLVTQTKRFSLNLNKSNQASLSVNQYDGQQSLQLKNFHTSQKLGKYKRASQDEDSDDDTTNPSFKEEHDSKIVKTNVNSLRADLLLKAGLGIARNKIEETFYDSKVRVNGQKILKKSSQVHEGDEIDIIKGFSQTNPSHLIVARVVVLSADDRDESINVHLRRYKSLLIENYAGANAYKSSGASQH